MSQLPRYRIPSFWLLYQPVPRKASSAIVVTLFGILINVKLLQSLKEPFPMEVTLFGMFIDVRLLQPLNVLLSIEVTLSGMLIEDRLLQPLKAPQ